MKILASTTTPPLNYQLKNTKKNLNLDLLRNSYINPTNYRNLTNEHARALKAQNLSFTALSRNLTDYRIELRSAISDNDIEKVKSVVEEARKNGELQSLLSSDITDYGRKMTALAFAEYQIPCAKTQKDSQERQEREEMVDLLFKNCKEEAEGFLFERRREEIADFLFGECEENVLASIFCTDKFDSNPIGYAVQNGRLKKYLDKAEELDKKAVKPHVLRTVLQLKDSQNNNLLHYLCGITNGNNISDIKSLREKAKKLGLWNDMQTEKNNDSCIPLHIAVGCNLETDEIARILFEDMPIETKEAMLLSSDNPNRKTPFAWAKQMQKIKHVSNKNLLLLIKEAEGLGIFEDMIWKSFTD